MSILSWKSASTGARRITAGLLLASFCGLGACKPGGGAQGPADMSTMAPAPDATIFVKVDAASAEANPYTANVRSQLVSSFNAAGYKLVESTEAGPDVVARVTLNATEEQSLFKTQVNGQVQKSYSVTISATLLASSDAAVIDQAESSFSSSDGQVDKAAVDQVVYAFNKSGKLQQWVANIKANQDKAEEDLWVAGNAEGCKNAKSNEACDGMETYLKKYPTGKHAAAARQAIEDGKASMKKAEEEAQAAKDEEKAAEDAKKEDAVWKAAVVDQCKKPTKSYDCKDVEAYLQRYPAGKYAADAKAAMKASEKAREALKKKEDAVKKRADRKECIRDCRRYYEKYYAYEILVNRCIQNECN